MSYADFSLASLQSQFGVRVRRQPGLFQEYPPVPVSSWLQETLRKLSPIGLEGNTEKARSECIVLPILAEVREQLERRVGLFSGVEFTVDPARGLRGACDFLLSLTEQLLAVEAPIAVVVEAKNENIPRGIGQCLAEMVAVQEFNEAHGDVTPTIYGAVTTGSIWRFLLLEGRVALLDETEYYLAQVEQIVGILVHGLKTALAARAAGEERVPTG